MFADGLLDEFKVLGRFWTVYSLDVFMDLFCGRSSMKSLKLILFLLMLLGFLQRSIKVILSEFDDF